MLLADMVLVRNQRVGLNAGVGEAGLDLKETERVS